LFADNKLCSTFGNGYIPIVQLDKRILEYKPKNTSDTSIAEATLLQQLQKGNELAFVQLYQKYHAALYLFALRFLHVEMLAKDVVHDVFVKVWDNRADLAAVTSFKSYLFTACKNHILNVLDRAAKEAHIKQEIAKQMSTMEPSVEIAWFVAEQEALLQQAIAQLPPKRREIFTLCRLEGKSYEEVAKIMEISVSTVNDHMVKAMKTLKIYLQQYPDLSLPLILLLIYN